MTTAGRILAAVVMVLGVGVIAIPTGLIGSALVERLARKGPKKCPHCGRDV